ncbi:ADP-ribosylglycohydrolase family protein [Aureibacillus halotolerans]|uniref:ADP-ribosylglycohydrolase n=1 Tax=Aureibacillus halotolerans TaxID=1508390 RepID=A0A4R6U698_9BACI|nr:ADP-ribosylglycohydrolase family protein [Aureibacillus halotolerans]TDQ41112.1 ADP-ribosylglycohydrolase [Aureibacillus halotolerans]
MSSYDKIAGTLYGMAIGDALGMPSELWNREKVKRYFGRIDTFLDGPQSNEVAKYFTKGQFTDDTSQALLLLDSLIENDFAPDEAIVAKNLMAWSYKVNAFEENILGPSSKAALTAIKDKEDPSPFTSKALTNGAAMRIAPIGCLFRPDEKEAMVDRIVTLSKVTHSTDVAYGGAAMIAMSVSAAIEDDDWDTIMEKAIEVYSIAEQKGSLTFSASIPERLRLGMLYAKELANDEEAFSQKIYDVIGTGTMTSESVPAALTIAYYAKDPKRCALLCANLGGDTDTIGAMATAICGAKAGFHGLPQEWVKVIDQYNEQSIQSYVDRIVNQLKKG